jgi:hypothetical protein
MVKALDVGSPTLEDRLPSRRFHTRGLAKPGRRLAMQGETAAAGAAREASQLELCLG